ncbi:3-hydroxyacyl-CoA dehydrogenase NAD-binding domain-containing protein [Dasania sp. GY-MA-18]|uniref:3-hydroxyacyl-CoA dehydrogenase NAD-binding domain-containing protein n=1 Tax=Dasania sp. GY-MA-18 TaxID=2966584 RepID=UPI0021ABAEA3|nr:3-hydroxyacyl-CoA dehydrogenase NAD-binding domain-containing protein [Dasania sp. GY-MA-18]MCR8924344.1 3-hydroxyacyl-CoA dehydrogenase NAD-binding domain-containing protein [Dasania sp. GY-MA-18]
MPVVNYQIENNVGVISINNPPVNALSHTLRTELVETITNAQQDESKILIMICQGRTFIAGADISEFGKPPQPPSLPDVLTTIEASNKPVIAAIHGQALGGGFEVALACHYRCALSSAKVGLPEVKLGLLPGAGGTQRVPRLAGVEMALDMITNGNPISAEKAQSYKLIDKVIEGDLFAGANSYAQELIETKAELKKARDISIDPTTVNNDLFANYREKLAKRARGQIAPQNIISCIEAAVMLPMDEGLAKERELFIECMQSNSSTAMRHLFFAQREATKVKGLNKDTPVRDVKSVAIIGGGTMGGGIAMNFANAGIPVKLVEINNEGITRGLAIIEKNYSVSVKKGKLSEKQKTHCMSLISGVIDYQELADVDLVIEAVFENLALKQEIFAELDKSCKAGAILASNTSYQDIDKIANATQRPQDVIGLHFFSPANIMKLLEIVRGSKTADDVIATSMKLAKIINKVSVLSGNCYGFIGNRILRQYAREAQLCLIEGSSPQQIDSVMQNFGMAMGPFAVGDLAGLDIGYKARQGLSDEQRGEEKTYCIADALVEMDRLGQKNGAGYYQYDPQTRARSNDPLVMDVVEQQAKAQGIKRRQFDDDEILNRLTFTMINEGAKILEEGIAQRSGDIDIVYVNGYGFPVFRGGPMQYADSLGLKNVYDTICQYREQYGEQYWQASVLLKDLALSNKTFSEWSKDK